MKSKKFGIWTVNNYGIESKKDCYYIEANRLLERRGNLPDWPLHMAEKNWSDLGNFIKAFLWALENHPKVLKMNNPFTRAELQKGINEALLDHFYIPTDAEKKLFENEWINADDL